MAKLTSKVTRFLFHIIIYLVLLCSCAPNSHKSIASTQTPETLLVFPKPRVINSPPNELNFPAPTIDSKGYFRLNNIYINKDVVDCYPAGYIEEINYSPDYKNILVLVHCVENLNQLFLFQSDGYGLLREITADSWETVLDNKYSWSTDGKSIVYFRTSCCTDAHSEIKAGLVRYDVETADRKLLVTYPNISYPENPPVWSSDGKWIAFLSPEIQNYPCVSLYVISSDGNILWKFEEFCLKDVQWGKAKLSWQINSENTLLTLEYVLNEKPLKGQYYIRDSKPASSSVFT